MEGVIKYNLCFEEAPALPKEAIEALAHYRSLVYGREWIGVDKDGLGYGNLSRRYGTKGQFIISGTQTGHLAQTGREHYTLVSGYDIAGNRLSCEGPVKASSEALTHAALYSIDSKINAVIHIHSAVLWQKYLDKLPTTAATVEYGTPVMAQEIARLYERSRLPETKVLVMAGHKDGIIGFGRDLQEAYEKLEGLER